LALNLLNTANVQSKTVSLQLVCGAHYQDREEHIAHLISQQFSLTPAARSEFKIAVILEGLPSGSNVLQASTHLLLDRIAPGCFCCIGNLAMKVCLNRILRQSPEFIYIGVASSAHLENIRATLQAPPYQQLLQLQDDLLL
jgi:hypothetical protein